MNLINYLIIGSTVGLLLLLWIIVGVRNLLGLRRIARDEWENVDEALRRRQDLVPLLIETIRKVDPSHKELEDGLILARIKAAREYDVSGNKVEYELDMVDGIEKMLAIGEAALARDSEFLGLKTEFNELAERIEAGTEAYNEKVRVYNRARGSFWLRVIALVGGFKRMDIFEVEWK